MAIERADAEHPMGIVFVARTPLACRACRGPDFPIVSWSCVRVLLAEHPVGKLYVWMIGEFCVHRWSRQSIAIVSLSYAHFLLQSIPWACLIVLLSVGVVCTPLACTASRGSILFLDDR